MIVLVTNKQRKQRQNEAITKFMCVRKYGQMKVLYG